MVNMEIQSTQPRSSGRGQADHSAGQNEEIINSSPRTLTLWWIFDIVIDIYAKENKKVNIKDSAFIIKMLRGLYDFRPINDKTIGFTAQELLLFLEPHARDKNWLRVASQNGRIGFVPINFIQVFRETTSEGLVAFLDEAIRRARRDSIPTLDLLISIRQNIITSPYTTEEHVAQIEREVMELRSKTISELNYEDGRHSSHSSRGHRSSKAATTVMPPHRSPNIEQIDKGKKKKHQLKAEDVDYVKASPQLLNNSLNQEDDCSSSNFPPPPPEAFATAAATTTASPPPDFCSYSPQPLPEPPFDPARLGAELVDLVRNATGLSHKLSQDAAEAVLHFVNEKFEKSDKLMELLVHLDKTPRILSTQPDVVAVCPDFRNLRRILARLTMAKEDEQQRSWALHEDESMILDNLSKLDVILTDADPRVAEAVLEAEKYRSVGELVLYYQMETRWSIRAQLIKCFHPLCTLDDKTHSIIVNSILPMELAREMRECRGSVEKIRILVDLLFTVLSTMEEIPITHFDYLDKNFVDFLLDQVEEDLIADNLMMLLFAYNLHFRAGRDNIIINALEGRTTNASVFTQKIIYFLNREVDPVEIRTPHRHPDAVMKLTTDIFTSKQSADLFYTNDTKVLIDIVTRCVTDLCSGDERRTAYLELIHVIIRNTNFIEHQHRREDLAACFASILQEEESSKDQGIVASIQSEFPDLFVTNYL